MDLSFGMGRYKNKLNLTKVGGAAIGVSTLNGPSRIQASTLLSLIHEIFNLSIY